MTFRDAGNSAGDDELARELLELRAAIQQLQQCQGVCVGDVVISSERVGAVINLIATNRLTGVSTVIHAALP